MDINGVQAIANVSNTIVTWSISIVGGSLLAILSTEFTKPIGKLSKLIYLIFIPGWFYLACAIKWGDSIARRNIMAAIKPERTSAIVEKMNDEFTYQLNDFKTALVFFGIWLLAFLLWWIFQDFITKPDKHY